MKILKIVILVVLVIIAVPLIAALFVKKEYAISRTIVVNRPPEEVYNYLKQLKNQDNFSKWNRTDQAMKKQYSPTDGIVGATYAWDSDKDAGKGVQEIKELVPGREIRNEIRFQKPFESKMQARFLTDAVAANQTKVTWAIDGRNPYPINFMNLFMPSMLGNDVDSSLMLLKSNLEQP